MNVRKESIILYITETSKNYTRRKPTVIFIFSFYLLGQDLNTDSSV